MRMISTLHTNMGIKIPIFHVTKSKTMLAFQNMLKIWSRWRWNFLNESNPMELDRFGIISNVKIQILVISKTGCMLVVGDLSPSSNHGLGKCRWNMSMKNVIFNLFWTRINHLIIYFWMSRIVSVLNRNRFRMLIILMYLVMLDQRYFKLKKFSYVLLML